jgi:hypothetical protein
MLRASCRGNLRRQDDLAGIESATWQQKMTAGGFMKAISIGRVLCALAIALACGTDIARADMWSCDQNVGDKVITQVWIVADDRLSTSSDDRRYRIIRNDARLLVAFHKDWEYKVAGGTPLVSYVIIDKTTGALIDLNDSVLTTLGAEYKDTATPDVAVGHCTVSQP